MVRILVTSKPWVVNWILLGLVVTFACVDDTAVAQKTNSPINFQKQVNHGKGSITIWNPFQDFCADVYCLETVISGSAFFGKWQL